MSGTHDLSLQAAMQHFKEGRFEKAGMVLDLLLQKRPDHFDALHMRGVIHGLMGDHASARISFERAIKINPRNNYVNFNLAKNLSEQGRDTEALVYCERAIELAPRHKEAWLMCGKISFNINQLPKAVTCYERALKLDPAYIEAMVNKAACHVALEEPDQAFLVLESAMQLGRSMQSNDTGIWFGLGNAYHALLKYDQALYCFDILLAIDPIHLNGCISKGRILLGLEYFEDAIGCFKNALSIDARCTEAAYKISEALNKLKKHDQAVVFLEKVISEGNDDLILLGALMINKSRDCDWRNYEAENSYLQRMIGDSLVVMPPFDFLFASDSPCLQLKAAEVWDVHKVKEVAYDFRQQKNQNGKIKIGYFSPDFSSHPVAFLSAGLFEMHNRNLFEIYGFSLRKAKENDVMRMRLMKGFDHFYEFDGQPSSEINAIVKDLQIDIAIDLTGHTKSSRTEIFQARLAPIQVNYLGYPGTMGGEAYDYIIGDKILIPDEAQEFYSEKIAYLPDCYQVNDSKRIISTKPFTRADFGLPSGGFIYCCHNASQKINPRMFSSWMRILISTQDSYLWLLGGDESVMKNLIASASAHGIGSDRLIFAKWAPPDEYLARYSLADLFLDTLPFNAGTTASDALWGGLPVLTQSGQSFAGRMATSILHNIGLPELITSSQDAYESIAVDLCNNPSKLKLLSDRLLVNKTTMPLFDTARFTKNLEQAYLGMHARYVANLAPDHIYVA
jgi:predicted O-linked N-acetylglucosamine transferase (SPINDLY family)